MFKTKNLIGRSVYETPEVVCMEVRTKYDNVLVTQILVSLNDFIPYYDENWIGKFIETSVIHLSLKDAKKEIAEGVLQYRNVRMQMK